MRKINLLLWIALFIAVCSNIAVAYYSTTLKNVLYTEKKASLQKDKCIRYLEQNITNNLNWLLGMSENDKLIIQYSETACADCLRKILISLYSYPDLENISIVSFKRKEAVELLVELNDAYEMNYNFIIDEKMTSDGIQLSIQKENLSIDILNISSSNVDYALELMKAVLARAKN